MQLHTLEHARIVELPVAPQRMDDGPDMCLKLCCFVFRYESEAFLRLLV